jgi:hypothetical protein
MRSPELLGLFFRAVVVSQGSDQKKAKTISIVTTILSDESNLNFIRESPSDHFTTKLCEEIKYFNGESREPVKAINDQLF